MRLITDIFIVIYKFSFIAISMLVILGRLLEVILYFNWEHMLVCYLRMQPGMWKRWIYSHPLQLKNK